MQPFNAKVSIEYWITITSLINYLPILCGLQSCSLSSKTTEILAQIFRAQTLRSTLSNIGRTLVSLRCLNISQVYRTRVQVSYCKVIPISPHNRRFHVTRCDTGFTVDIVRGMHGIPSSLIFFQVSACTEAGSRYENIQWT